jgi:bifunctional DNase/RNase
MTVEMRIQGLLVDPITKSPIVLLADTSSNAKLPLFVGIFEADAIARALERVTPPRPMTHDLMRDLVSHLGAQVDRVVIHDLKDNVFYALLMLKTPNGPIEVDVRPSDAIALALRTGSPIYARRSVIDAAQHLDLLAGHEDAERMRRWLEGLDDNELGKYEV